VGECKGRREHGRVTKKKGRYRCKNGNARHMDTRRGAGNQRRAELRTKEGTGRMMDQWGKIEKTGENV